MERYLRYGLVLFPVWIIASSVTFLIILVLSSYPDFLLDYVPAGVLLAITVPIGLLAVVAGIVITVELKGTAWDIKRIAMTFLGITLIIVGAFYALINSVINIVLPALSVAADGQTVVGWVSTAVRVFHGIAALLIIVSLQEEGAVARTGLFLYSVVAAARILFQFFGMGGNLGIGVSLTLLAIVAAILILKRV
jgi:hypothetical protein